MQLQATNRRSVGKQIMPTNKVIDYTNRQYGTTVKAYLPSDRKNMMQFVQFRHDIAVSIDNIYYVFVQMYYRSGINTIIYHTGGQSTFSEISIVYNPGHPIDKTFTEYVYSDLKELWGDATYMRIPA
jgi:hypothetical protein